MEQLIQEQTTEINELQSEFGNASSLMDQKYRQLNEKFVELQELYNNRPSRPEDLELIRTLQEEIVAKEAAIKKAAEDMKFYKLELINREQSYNQMFGTNPNIGLLNVAGGKTAKVGAPVGSAGMPPLSSKNNMMSQKDIGRKNPRVS